MEASTLQKKMEMATNKCRKQSKDEQMTRKKKKVNRFAFLSDDILLEILKRLPEDFLRYQAKHVCTRWFNIVTNGILLDHASFIIQAINDSTVRHVNITEQLQGLQVKEQNLEIPLPGWIVSWCNEFLLVTNYEKNEYVFNLITNEGSFLPHCTSCEGYNSSYCGVSFYFDRFKGVYKVLHVFMGPPVQCHILILRKNILSRLSSNWNKIEVPSYINERSGYWGDHRRCYWGDPVSVRGRYFHWDVRGDDRYLVSMDMVKEKMIRINLPVSVTSYGYTVFEMGGFLTLLHQDMGGFVTILDQDPWKQADMWILKDFDRMKWEKLEVSISDWWYFGEYLGKYSDAVSSVSKRYLTCMKISSWDGGICSYDLKDGHVKELDIKIGSRDRRVVHSSTPSFI